MQRGNLGRLLKVLTIDDQFGSVQAYISPFVEVGAV